MDTNQTALRVFKLTMPVSCVQVDDACSSYYSAVDRTESSVLSLTSHSSSALRTGDSAPNYYQCIDNDVLVESLMCGSFFELDTEYYGLICDRSLTWSISLCHSLYMVQ